MKRSKTIVLSLIVALALLLAACPDGMEEGELATVTISLGNPDISRQLVGLGTASGTTSETHTHKYKLKIDDGGFKDFIPGSTFSVVTGSHTFEVRAYGNPDTIWAEPNYPHPFPPEIPVLRAIGKTSGTVSRSGPNRFPVSLDSATEVTSWSELAWAVQDPKNLYSESRKEIIFLKNPDGFSAVSTITINREIELRAEGCDVTIIRDSDFTEEFFNVAGADSTIGTVAGKLAIGRTLPLSETDKGSNIGSPIILDGGSTDDPDTSISALAPLITTAGDCIIGKDVILENNANDGGYTPGGVLVTGGTFTLYGQIINNYAANTDIVTNTVTGNGGGVYMSGGNFVMKEGSVIAGNTAGNSGGGVYIAYGAEAGGTLSFVMEPGARIESNSANFGGGVSISGISTVVHTITFQMKGGIIGGEDKQNTADNGGGGGVFLNGQNATFQMECDAIISSNVTNANGGGVLIAAGTFNMIGGSISGNNAFFTVDGTGNGGGVALMALMGGFFNMSGGIITNNKAAPDSDPETGVGGGVYITSGKFDISAAAEQEYKNWVKDNLDSSIPPADVWIDSNNSSAEIIGGPGYNNGW